MSDWVTGNWIDCENKQDAIKFKTRTMAEAERIGDALDVVADSPWIPVSERLPPKDRLCVTRFQPVMESEKRGGGIRLREHFEIGLGISIFGSRTARDWVFIPEPPK
tara:strand:- start:308 stop:628 length:321 start_codon:yes stop_codon:yes gene_type:complete